MDRVLRLGDPQGPERRGGRARGRHALTGAADLNVALLGYGYAARTFHAPLIAATPGLALIRAGVRSEAAAAAARAAGLAPGTVDEVLADPTIDLAVVATPTAEHAVHAAAALRAGKHVVVDKPLAADGPAAASLVRLAEREGRLLTVFHNRRWDVDVLALRAVLAGGELGQLVELTSAWDRWRPVVRDRWRERPGPGAGIWWDLGAHLLDQALVLFGPPADLVADIGVERPGALVADRFHVRLRYPSGLRVVLESRSLARAPAPRFVAHGTRGSFVKHGLDPQEAALQAGARPGDRVWGVDPTPGTLTLAGGEGARDTPAPSPRGDYGSFYAAVRDALRLGGPPPVAASEAAAVVGWLELAEASAAAGRALSP